MPPLKRRKELQPLSEDHHNALVIALRCRRFSEGRFEAEIESFRASVVDFYERALLPHFEVEEELLLPALAEADENAMRERIATDHEKLHAAVAQRFPDLESFGRFGALLDDHIRYEERTVFEQVQDRLPSGVLAAIETKSRETAQICPTTLRPIPRGGS